MWWTMWREALKLLPPVEQGWTQPSMMAREVLAVARSELGNGETLGNNRGPDLDRYRGKQGNDEGAWCAAFVIFCIEEACKRIGRSCPVKRSHNAKRLWKNILAAGGTRVDFPAPGDIPLWHRGAKNALTGHIAIQATPVKLGEWSAIEGNKGGWPSTVREFPHVVGEPLFLGWARLP